MSTKETLFSAPVREDKISKTDRAARTIIGAEDDARRSKTNRLRAARIEKEEREAAIEASAPAKPAKPAAKRVRRIKA